jgi:ornithine cyclodeaminase/alanine dehydrogenase-like protein (mu-crystallin family)
VSISLQVIDASTIKALAPPSDVMEWVREAMLETSRRRVQLPLRRAMSLPAGKGALVTMSGYLQKLETAGVKVLSIVPAASRRGASHLGLMLLYDADGLVPVALLCASTITSLRTAAATAVATDVLARRHPRTLAILGAGEQARAHITALSNVREWKECRIWNRTRTAAEDLVTHCAIAGVEMRVCESVSQAASGADVICTVTAARSPILRSPMVSLGAHVNLIGSGSAEALEADEELVGMSRYFVDYWPSALDQAGELLAALKRGLITESHIQAEIGEVLASARAGRTNDDDITVYKSVGIASQDIVTARRVYERAIAAKLGSTVTL